MDNLLNTGLQIILWLQSLGEWLTPIMRLFTFLGNEQFYLLVAPAILWCIDAPLGLRMGVFLMINGMLNSALKVAFHGPRPYWYSSDMKVLSNAETSFGVPSGHAQNAVVVWGTLADRLKHNTAWIIAIVVMLLIGISRLYLAVHFPHDVLIGWIFGAIVLWILLKFERPVINWFKQYRMGIQILICFLFTLFLILLVIIAKSSLLNWNLPQDWIANALVTFPEEPAIDPLSYHNFLTSPGAFFGMAAGWIWLSKLGGFSTKGRLLHLLLRYILGLIGVLILYIGLGTLFPENETFFSYSLRYIRYALIGFWISGFAPWLFIKLKLANRKN